MKFVDVRKYIEYLNDQFHLVKDKDSIVQLSREYYDNFLQIGRTIEDLNSITDENKIYEYTKTTNEISLQNYIGSLELNFFTFIRWSNFNPSIVLNQFNKIKHNLFAFFNIITNNNIKLTNLELIKDLINALKKSRTPSEIANHIINQELKTYFSNTHYTKIRPDYPFQKIQLDLLTHFSVLDDLLNLFYQPSIQVLMNYSIPNSDKIILCEIISNATRREMDKMILFDSLPRKRESFSEKFLKYIINEITIPENRKILDLFCNTGIIGFLGFILGKEKILLNDQSYKAYDSSLNKYLDSLNNMFLEKCGNKLSDLESIKKCFDGILTSEKREELHKIFINQQSSSEELFLPLYYNTVSPINLWALSGIPINFIKGFDNKLVFKNVRITQNTKFKEIDDDLYDLIILDPPFGMVSKYQVDPSEGIEILNWSIQISSKLIRNKGTVIVRIPRNWQDKIELPTDWEKQDELSGEIILQKYHVSC
ncbi:MAG: hypothetical protein HeimC3_16720 [Candidatus Heimdallarchaeota archaeon LC_3]|nr:MAG: hypothetical protein HeimC3_16720 [Candidatus Heimdallarchaeota archaeon LC_3]